MNRRKVLWVVVAAQIVVLGGMIAQKEYIMTTGTPIRLAVAPVDPVDLMRGDYVNLTYTISRLDCLHIVGCNETYQAGDSIYVELMPAGGVWHAEAVSHDLGQRPGAVYIRGNVSGVSTYTHELSVEYGIESYYVAEHSGGDIERRFPRRRSGVSADSLTAEVVVPGSHYGQLRQLFLNGESLLP
jgi:uncharacterized membrane-anchored protein